MNEFGVVKCNKEPEDFLKTSYMAKTSGPASEYIYHACMAKCLAMNIKLS